MGFCRKYTEFQLAHSFHYMGVRFLPTMFPQIFKISAAELSNRYEHLSNVVPDLSSFIVRHLHNQLTTGQLQKALDSYFIVVVQNTAFDYDSRLYEAIRKILLESGVVTIEQDLNTGISQRQLRRLFNFYIGDTAKTFAQVVRFQNILRAKPSSQSLRQNKLFFDAGYYDQAHFIKEFRNFYGVTPGRAFGR